MRTILVTGGTGLIGSNICRQLVERGDSVRALARPGSHTEPLLALGATVVAGDITDDASVRAAAEGCEAVIHSAAVLGGVVQDPDHHRGVNIGGLSSVLDAAAHYGMSRVVTLGTTTYFDFKTAPLTETSPVDPDAPLDPYTQTKRAAYLEAMRRAAEGLDVCVVIPGGTYGPAPATERAMEAPSFNLRMLQAIRGELTETVRFPIPWSLAADVATASVAALDRGRRGETYLAFGPPGDVSSMATWLNRACELAGVTHRVREIGPEDLDADPELKAQIIPSLEALTRQQFPEPYFINNTTVERLHYHPLSTEEGLPMTIDWLRATQMSGAGA
jgi:dihydroflavonol-4-reductase